MKKIFVTVLILFSVILASFPVSISADDTVDPNVNGELGQRVDSILSAKKYSGTFLIVKDGKPVYQASRGYSNYANGIYNDGNTVYEIDSIQKSLTAALIMQEVQRGKLELSDKLYKFYPKVPGSKKITIRQMLDMTSGLVLSGDVGPNKVMSDSDIIDADIKHVRFSQLSYNKWNYQAINFNLLSGILEQVTGKSYQKLFTQTYIKKLGLKHTIFAYDAKSDIQKATGYTNIDPLSSKLEYNNAFYTKRYFQFDELGTGQVFMSVNDLYKVEKYVLTGSLLTDESRKELFKPGSVSTYGGGMYHAKNDNFANGWGYGFQSVIHISNDGKDAVIALGNYSRLSADTKPMVKEVYGIIKNE